ncbi:hypothetical protein B566_EDAN006877, partial [Ephemera danica]
MRTLRGSCTPLLPYKRRATHLGGNSDSSTMWGSHLKVLCCLLLQATTIWAAVEDVKSSSDKSTETSASKTPKTEALYARPDYAVPSYNDYNRLSPYNDPYARPTSSYDPSYRGYDGGRGGGYGGLGTGYYGGGSYGGSSNGGGGYGSSGYGSGGYQSPSYGGGSGGYQNNRYNSGGWGTGYSNNGWSNGSGYNGGDSWNRYNGNTYNNRDYQDHYTGSWTGRPVTGGLHGGGYQYYQ